MTGSNYPSSLSNTVTEPGRPRAAAHRPATLNATDGDETGDYTPFWAERDYNPDVYEGEGERLRRPRHQRRQRRPTTSASGGTGWRRTTSPRKLWLDPEGHVDPFDFRRAEWVTRCTAGSTTGCTASRTGSWTSRWPTSSAPPTSGRPFRRLARPGGAEDGALPEGRSPGRPAVLVRGAGPARRPTVTFLDTRTSRRPR